MYSSSPYGLYPYGAGVSGAAVIGEPRAAIPYHSAFNVANDECTFEIVATSETIGTGESVLITNRTTDTPSDYSFTLLRDADTLELYLSSDGSTWDIANGVDVGTITVSEFKFTWERIGNEIITYLNGEETARIATSASIYDPENDLIIGAYDDDTDVWYGSVQAFRWCIGQVRYGADHDATATPFADSDSYASGTVYSDNFALFMGDIAASNLYGLGAPTEGLAESKEWCLTLLDDDETEQATGGLVLPSARRAEYWLNILGDYAACLWFPYGESIRIQPDKGIDETRPSGQEICEYGEFDADTGWTVNDWVIGSGVAAIDGTQVSETTLSRALTTEDGEGYGVALEITAISAGSISVEIGGSEVMSAQTSVGTYYGAYTASGTSNDIEIIASADCVATVNLVSVRRLFWLQDNWLAGSISIQGASVRQTPNRVQVAYEIPASDTPNWSKGEGVATLPDANDGTVPLIATQVSMPGLPTLQQASNRAVRKINRTRLKLDIGYGAPDSGVLHRKGDGIQLKRALRGVDVKMWVEDVEMRDYGRYSISGVLYSDSHFTLSTGLDMFEAAYDHESADQGEKQVGETVYIANPDTGQMSHSTVIDRDDDAGTILVSVNEYGTLLDTMDLAGTSFTLPANEGSPTVGWQESGLNTGDAIVLDKVAGMTYEAMSPYANDEGPIGDGKLPWMHLFSVRADSGDSDYVIAESLSASGSESAMIAASPVVLTGSTSYLIFGKDEPIYDNRGGISLRIWKF